MSTLTPVLLSSLVAGEYFHLVDSESAPMWVRDHYDRSSRRYCCHKYDDVCHESFFKGSRIVYVYSSK